MAITKFDRIDYIKSQKIGNGTCWMGKMQLKPIDVIKTFGDRDPGSDKASGEYTFLNEDGNLLFTLYEWKTTTEYDEKNDYTPKEFWSLNKDMKFNIGGREKNKWDDQKNLAAFEIWLRVSIRNYKNNNKKR